MGREIVLILPQFRDLYSQYVNLYLDMHFAAQSLLLAYQQRRQFNSGHRHELSRWWPDTHAGPWHATGCSPHFSSIHFSFTSDNILLYQILL